MKPAASPDSLPNLGLLEQTPIIIEKILYSANADHFQWKPAADRWSIAEVLTHLVEVEGVFRERARSIVEQENPRLEAYDQNAAYAAGRYSGREGREQLRRFCHERDLTMSWLRYVPAAAAHRLAQHAEIGRITLGELVHEWAFHDLGHVRQIAELLRARAFYPRMGGFQRYYTIKP